MAEVTLVSILGALMCFLLVRNQYVYAVRMAFIYSKDFPRDYERLPGYYSMVQNPKYWLLWTRAHWLAWLQRRPVSAEAQL